MNRGFAEQNGYVTGRKPVTLLLYKFRHALA